MYERVIGPVNGYFVAVYACEMGERYLGFYKICRGEPASYWESECLIKGCSKQLSFRGSEALRAAEADAKYRVEHLPPVTELAAAREKRGLYWFEREDLKHPTRPTAAAWRWAALQGDVSYIANNALTMAAQNSVPK